MPNFTHQRQGSVIPLFAVVFPVLMIFCAMAINLAHVQLSNTEMQIAIDVAVHAGGRRLGTPIANANGTVQSLDEAKADVMDFAAEIAAMNTVSGSPAEIPENVMEFGRSSRVIRNNGTFAPYEFHPVENNQIPSSFRIVSNNLRLRHLFGPFSSYGGATPSDSFTVAAASVSTQVDRDVVLVLDRSGSMLYFEDEDLILDTLFDISEESYTVPGESVTEFRVIFRRFQNGAWSGWFFSSVYPNFLTQSEFDTTVTTGTSTLEYRLWEPSARERPGMDETFDKITDAEYDDASESLYDRWYTNDVVYWLEDKENQDHTLGESPEDWTDGLTVNEQRAKLTGHMALYAHDYRHRYKLNNRDIRWFNQIDIRQAPAFSRWYHLDRGVTVFLNVLGGGVDPDGGTLRDGTVQKELISILPFNSSPDTITATFGGVNYADNNSNFDYGLQDDGFPAAFVNDSNDPGYDVPHPGSSISIRDVLPTICPYGGTAIGSSLREGVELIRNASEDNPDARSRPFAAKTIVVLTDGNNTVGDNPVNVARDELATEDVIVHTITFTPGVSDAGKEAMADVAEFGRGRHYHTDSGAALARIFEEIANNLPTILTQ